MKDGNLYFSIVMPFYNSEEYIERAILSVINQTYKYYELIAVNDGSLDGSLSIIRKYAKKDKRIKILSKPNGGYSTAVNMGLDNLSPFSDYFIMLGSDDELSPNLLELLFDKVRFEKFDIIGFRTKIIRCDGNEEWEKYSYIEHDVVEKNITINRFYEIHNDINQLFAVRDTSRAFKTCLLKDLRYFGRYGIAADACFSILFSFKCKSFAHFTIGNYIWHLRSESISQKKKDLEKSIDIFTNLISFFDIVLQNNYVLTSTSIECIDALIGTFLIILECNNKETFKKNIHNIYKARRQILKLIKLYDVSLPVKKYIKILYPKLYRLLVSKR